MFKLLTVLAGLLFLSAFGWSDDIDRSNSFTLEKDASTGIWAAECSISVRGIDKMGDYFAGTIFQPPSALRPKCFDDLQYI